MSKNLTMSKPTRPKHPPRKTSADDTCDNCRLTHRACPAKGKTPWEWCQKMFPSRGPYQKTRKYESRIRKPGKRQHVAKRLRDLESAEREAKNSESAARHTPSTSPPLVMRSTAPTTAPSPPSDIPIQTLPPKLRAKNWAKQAVTGSSPIADENETDGDGWSGSDSSTSASSKTSKPLTDNRNTYREERKEEQEDKKQILEPSTLHHLNRNRNHSADDREGYLSIPEETVYTVRIPRSRYQGDGYVRFVDAEDGSILGLHMHTVWSGTEEDSKEKNNLEDQRTIANIVKQEKRSRLDFEDDMHHIGAEHKPKYRRLVSGREREKHRDYDDEEALRGIRVANWRE